MDGRRAWTVESLSFRRMAVKTCALLSTSSTGRQQSVWACFVKGHRSRAVTVGEGSKE
jgi:hypothetical protein